MNESENQFSFTRVALTTGGRAKHQVLSNILRSPQHTLHPKLPRLLPLPFRWGEGWGVGWLCVVYPAVWAVLSVFLQERSI